MSTTLADAYVRLRPDTRQLGRELIKGTEREAAAAGDAAGRTFGANMKSAALAIAAGATIVGGIVAIGAKQAIDSARDLGETQSKVDVVFGKSAANVKQWAASMANDFGQSQKAALDGAATFAIYGKAAGKSGKDLFNFSTDLTTLASDMASFSNTSPEEAIEAIGAAMRGESDPIEKYGVLLNETVLKNVAMKKGIISTTKDALTPQQRVLAVQAALFEQLGSKGSKTIGDFERTSGSLANQQRILRANLENTKATIGQALLPVATKFVTMLNTKAIPAINSLWSVHGPKVIAFLDDLAAKMGTAGASLENADWSKGAEKAGAVFADLRPTVELLGLLLTGTVIPALRAAGPAIRDLTGWLNEHETTTRVLTVTIAAGVVGVRAWQAAVVVARVATVAWGVATRAAAAVHAGYNAVLAIGNTTLGTWVGVKALEFAAWVRSTAATVASTTATVAHTVVSKAARAATIAWTAVQWALNSAFLANPITLIVMLIVGLIAVIIQAYRHNETFRKIVQAVWAGIKVAIKAVGDWFVQTLWPSLRTAFNQLMTVARTLWTVYSSVWKAVWVAISTYYGFMYDKVFMPLKNLIMVTLPNAFKSGVGFISRWWQGLQEVARRPVDFVVNTVINKGIIGSLNWLADKVGIKNRIAPFRFGDGIGTGAPRIPSGRDNADHLGDGYGQGDGMGIIDAVRNPAKWLTDRVGLDGLSRFGDNPFVRMVSGAGRTAIGYGVTRAKELLGELFGGGGGGVGANGLQAGISGVLAMLRSVFGNVPLISGLRPGSTTLSGRTSYHASGRAIDLPAVRAWAEYLRATVGGKLRELITPWRDINMLNGRPHRYSYAIEAQHGVYGNNAHIHAAMDRGGFLVPGWNEPIYNGTGRLEPVTPASTMDEVVSALMAILAVLERLAPELARELRGTTRGAMTLARGMV